MKVGYIASQRFDNSRGDFIKTVIGARIRRNYGVLAPNRVESDRYCSRLAKSGRDEVILKNEGASLEGHLVHG